MGNAPDPWFCVPMNKRNEHRRAMLHRDTARRAGDPAKLRLRILMKESPAWVVPLIKEASASMRSSSKAVPTRAPRTLQLSLVRSVAQSALRRGNSFWGR